MPSGSRSAFIRIGLGIALLLGLVATIIVFVVKDRAKANSVAAAKAAEHEGEAVAVKVIHPSMVDPRTSRPLLLTVDRPVSTEPYNKNNIEAQVSGLVDMIRVAPGSFVSRGQELVRIAVPDLQARLKKAEAVLGQRNSELELANKKLHQADLAKKTAKDNEKFKVEIREQRKIEYDRYYRLYYRQNKSVDKDDLDRAEAVYKAAVADEKKANSEVKDAEASYQVALAEVKVKTDLIKVAQAHVGQALALIEFASIKANFPGYIVRRRVDPSSLVQNASNSAGHATPILTLDETDTLTVVMHVPDNYARFIDQDTDAILELENIPGLKIKGKVTRFVKSLESQQQDRTMRVEVDLWNGSTEAYRKAMVDPDFLRVLKEGKLKDGFLWRLWLHGFLPQVGTYLPNGLTKDLVEWLARVVVSAADIKSLENGQLPADALESLREDSTADKGRTPRLPQIPTYEPSRSSHAELLPGMYGKMTLVLKPTRRLIPSKAIVHEAGQAYVYAAEHDKARRVPVEVRVIDKNYAYVVELDDSGEPLGQLPADTQVVVTELDQMSPGVEVKASILDDWSKLQAHSEAATATEEAAPDTDATPTTVNVIKPALHDNFRLTMNRPVTIQPYYRNNIDAQVSGIVKDIFVANGTRVARGDELVVIDVPDLEAKYKEARALRDQTYSEKIKAEERVLQADQVIHTAEANKDLKATLVGLRKEQEGRYKDLLASQGIDRDVYEGAVAAREAAEADVELAQAQIDDARAAKESAVAEVKVKENLIKVADAELELAEVMRSFATIRASFNGFIQERRVDRGSLVQNASNGGGRATPILTLERSDIVTVLMRVPDNFAAYINKDTDVILRLENKPGLTIQGKITRFARSLETEQNDKTMRVEVDLWNGSVAEYEQAMQDLNFLRNLKEWNRSIKPWDPKQGNTLEQQIKEWQEQGWNPPLLPKFVGENVNKNSTELLPGMYGKMTLVLQKFPEGTHLIPSQAVVREPNQTYIYTVVDGKKAHKVPVAEQLDDGNYAYVRRVKPTGEKGKVEDLGPLPEDAEVIVTNLEELSEGQPVTPIPLENWSQLHKSARK